MDEREQQRRADEAAEAILHGKEMLYIDNFLPITAKEAVPKEVKLKGLNL